MKINKMICIDEETAKKLDEINASELINRLLKDHFSENIDKNLAYLKQEYAKNHLILKESKAKEKEFKKHIDRMEAREHKILTSFNKITPEQEKILRECKNFNIIIYNRSLKEYFKGYGYDLVNHYWRLINGNIQ